MGSARLVFGFGGHGQRRQRREGGGEQPPQLQGTVEGFRDSLPFVMDITYICYNYVVFF